MLLASLDPTLTTAGTMQGWAIASDKIGRKNTYSTFALGIPMMAGTPFLIEQVPPPLSLCRVWSRALTLT